jgi:hypothetical protein
VSGSSTARLIFLKLNKLAKSLNMLLYYVQGHSSSSKTTTKPGNELLGHNSRSAPR